MSIPFWSNDPAILLNKQYILEIWPTNNMTYEEKLNSITRLICLLTILGFIVTQSYRIIIVGIITIAGIYVLYKTNKQKLTKQILNEGFSGLGGANATASARNETTLNPETLKPFLKSEFKEGNKKNPFSNVLLTEIMDDPKRKAAPPSFNVDVDQDITKNIKKAVQRMNSGIHNTNHQLYGDLYENFELDQSNRHFYSTANTNVQPGDQSSFARYLYGVLPSAKDSDALGNWQREKDSYRYTLY